MAEKNRKSNYNMNLVRSNLKQFGSNLRFVNFTQSYPIYFYWLISFCNFGFRSPKVIGFFIVREKELVMDQTRAVFGAQ